jgi:hypothetical protein
MYRYAQHDISKVLYKQQNQASRIGLPDFISYLQKITGVTRDNFA